MATRKGKVIDTWTFYVDRQKVTVDVRMKDVDSRYSSDKEFYVEAEAPVKMYFKNTDIVQLKRAVEKELKEKMGLTWSGKLVVSVGGEFKPGHAPDDDDRDPTLWPGQSGSGELSVNWRAVHEGTNAAGEKFHSTDVQHRSVYAGAVADTHKGVVIEDTAANRRAVNEFIAAMKKLRQKIGVMLDADNLPRTIAAIIAGASPLAIAPPAAPAAPEPAAPPAAGAEPAPPPGPHKRPRKPSGPGR